MELGEGTDRKGEGEKKSRMTPRSGFWLAEEEESGKEKSQISSNHLKTHKSKDI